MRCAAYSIACGKERGIFVPERYCFRNYGAADDNRDARRARKGHEKGVQASGAGKESRTKGTDETDGVADA